MQWFLDHVGRCIAETSQTFNQTVALFFTLRHGNSAIVNPWRPKGPLTGSNDMAAICKRFFGDDEGATAIEYALLGSLLALVLVGALTALGTGLSSEFTEISGVMK